MRYMPQLLLVFRSLNAHVTQKWATNIEKNVPPPPKKKKQNNWNTDTKSRKLDDGQFHYTLTDLKWLKVEEN